MDLSLVVPIVGDAAIAGPIADGRLIPVLILDTSDRPEVRELIRVHTHQYPGDVESLWGRSLNNPDDVMLHLSFTHPMELQMVLLIGIERQAILVETMLQAGATYLQTGVAGDRLIDRLDAPRLLVELPDTGFRPAWERILLTRMTAVMARELRIRRRKARPAAQRLIAEIKGLARLRLEQPGTEGFVEED